MRRHDRTGTTCAERGLLHGSWLLSGYGLRASRTLGWLAAAMLVTIVLLMGFALPKDSPKQDATGTVPPGGGKVTFEIDKADPQNPTGDRFTGERFEKTLNVTLNSVVFRSSGQDLTTAGTYIRWRPASPSPSFWAWRSWRSVTASNADPASPRPGVGSVPGEGFVRGDGQGGRPRAAACKKREEVAGQEGGSGKDHRQEDHRQEDHRLESDCEEGGRQEAPPHRVGGPKPRLEGRWRCGPSFRDSPRAGAEVRPPGVAARGMVSGCGWLRQAWL
ncbi:hypothetical protein ABZY09_35695 [Streptomyces sp. NPDC002928]|uniref:hypothetical protein n=1 Tax=Streptomyces sp. NPDC002928 TaxID=3154440 RepID=UPI0033AB14C4